MSTPVSLRRRSSLSVAAVAVLLAGFALPAEAASLRVGVFQADATPPLGSPVAYAAARKIEDPLTARGVVLLGAGEPIVLCAVDWIGIANGGHDLWREKLAQAAGTQVERVAVHALHQHDGVRCDFTAEELLEKHGLGGKRFDPAFARRTIESTAAAVRRAVEDAQPVTHLGVGRAKVEQVASNRRILGPDGKVKLFRMSSWRISEPIARRLNEAALRDGYTISPLHVQEAIDAPEGVIDPLLRMVSFWNGERPIVCLSYYATHPQSYFGQGDVTSEFVGLARAQREQALRGLPHIHFNGAGGNIAAGKYNDGTPETRVSLTRRMAEGMRQAWEATEKTPLSADDIQWRVRPVKLPPNEHLDLNQLRKTLADSNAEENARLAAATKTAFLTRLEQGHEIELSCLQMKNVYLLHMPGELFVEYQLAAQQMRPEAEVCMAAYGDYGTGYIGTEAAYAEGGYETSPRSSNVAPQVEAVLMEGLRSLLQVEPPPLRKRSDPPVIESSWDDLLDGVKTADDWKQRQSLLRGRYLELIRDQYKPQKPPLDLQVHETKIVDETYRRLYVSYNVESDERAYAYLGVPLDLAGKAPGVVALHGTFREGTKQAAGLVDNPDKAYLDHLCRRGYVVIAPEHFVSGERVPPEGPYETGRFYQKHPQWTAVGKFTYEHSIAVDVLQSRAEVDPERIGAMGHSLGGHGTFYLAAYDERIKAAVCNCGGSFLRHNPHVEAWARDRWYVYLKPIRPGLLRGELPPIDVHEIISLIAPRAYLDVSALNDGNPLTQRQRVLMLMKIADVYERLGRAENFAFFVHGRGHSVPHESRELIYGFLDAHLKPPEATKTRLVVE